MISERNHKMVIFFFFGLDYWAFFFPHNSAAAPNSVWLATGAPVALKDTPRQGIYVRVHAYVCMYTTYVRMCVCVCV